MVIHVLLNKLMHWMKSWSELGLELDGVINIEVDPACLVERLEWSYSFVAETGATYHKVFNPPAEYK